MVLGGLRCGFAVSFCSLGDFLDDSCGVCK